jgi:hypothetical protein
MAVLLAVLLAVSKAACSVVTRAMLTADTTGYWKAVLKGLLTAES